MRKLILRYVNGNIGPSMDAKNSESYIYTSLLTQLRQTYGFDAVDPDRIPSMDEKIKLSYDIFKIGN